MPSEWNGFGFEALAREVADGLAADGGHAEVLVCDKALPSGDPSTLPPATAAPETGAAEQAVRWLFYTSGTTADPKGAQHTDGSIAVVARNMADRLAVTASDRNSMVFPFTHIGGITWLFTSLATGCSNIFLEAFHPQNTPATLSRHGVTLAGAGTPFHMVYLAYQKERETPIFPDVRGFPGGGAPKPPQLVVDIRSVFDAPVLSGYGLTEAPILTMASIEDGDDELARSEGKPMPGVDIRLVTLDGAPAGPGEEGEVRAKAPQLMRGYLDEALNADAFDADGYFRTGDLGRFDDAGNLMITGRVKDIIIRKGENISAKEVEDALFTHPAVADVAVIGLPDPRSGERACAVVVTAPDAESITMETMAEHLRGEGLMNQKIPEQLELVEQLPRNPAGKVLKHVLQKQYAEST